MPALKLWKGKRLPTLLKRRTLPSGKYNYSRESAITFSCREFLLLFGCRDIWTDAIYTKYKKCYVYTEMILGPKKYQEHLLAQ